MTTSKAINWPNLIASIGVLAGLLLVAYELRQNNEIARAETFQTMWQMVSELTKIEVETDILQIYRRSIDDPLSLSDDDIDRLDSYLWLYFDTQTVKAVMRETYGLYDVSVERQANDSADYYLAGRFGRAWYAENKSAIAVYNPEFAEAVSERLANTPVELSHSYPEQLRSRIKRLDENE